MKKIFRKGFVIPVALAVLGTAFVASTALAATPTFSVVNTGNGDAVNMTVTGDPNKTITLYYNVAAPTGMQTLSIGATDGNGNFTMTFSPSTYGILAGYQAYILVNSQQSSMLSWPYAGSSSGAPQLTQTTVNVGVGQTATVTSYGTSNPITLTNNSNYTIASVSVTGSQITVYGNNAGTDYATVCYQSNTSSCTTLTIVVGGFGGSGLTFGQSTATLGAGQYLSVSISGGTNGYYISNNSNQSVVQASILGSSLALTGGGTTGSSIVTVCAVGTGSCGTVLVTNGSGGSSGAITFSPSNPTVNVGQSQYVYLSGGSGTYYISSNSTNSIVQASLSGNTLTLYGATTGTANIMVCASSGGCGTLYVTVGSTGTGSISFSQTNPTVNVGQTVTDYVYGGSGSYYISSYSNSIVQATLSGSSLNLYGLSSGYATVTVCASTGGCGTLSLTVGGGTNSSGGALIASQVLSVGQGVNLMISGGTLPYSVSTPSGGYFTATLNSGSVLTLQGVTAGISSVNVCANTGGCLTINVTVVGATTPSGGTGTSGYKFYSPLGLGSEGADVTQLQNRLTTDGYYSGPITGYFGSLTMAAVKRYQSAHGLDPLGFVGPATRAALNGQ